MIDKYWVGIMVSIGNFAGMSLIDVRKLKTRDFFMIYTNYDNE